MTLIVNVQEAKTRLSELLRRVEAGESIEIARSGQVIARLEAVQPVRRNLSSPLLPGLSPFDDADLLGPLDEDELAAWENGHPGDPMAERQA